MTQRKPPLPWVDYSHEVKPLRSRWQRHLLISLGTLFFLTGLVGVFLPLLPTTPFLLLSAACYARASARFYNWLMNHYLLGAYLRDWRSHQGVPARAKITAIALMGVCFGISMVFVVKAFWPRAVLLSIGVMVAIYIIRLPTRHLPK